MYAVKFIGKTRVFTMPPCLVFTKKLAVGNHRVSITACVTSNKVHGSELPTGYAVGFGAFVHDMKFRGEHMTDLLIQVGPFRLNIFHRKTV